MASDVKNFGNQLQYNGEGPLDAKQRPVETVNDLPNGILAYEGQTITVMSDPDGQTSDYIFLNDRWVKKCQGIDAGEL